MPIPVYVDIVDTDQQIITAMLKELVVKLNQKIPVRMSRMDSKMRQATYAFLQSTSTYKSLATGDLAAHFGLPPFSRIPSINIIIQSVANRMEITYKPIRFRAGHFANGIKFRVLLKDLSEVLSLPEGIITTEKGQDLPWLKWLLTFGDRFIISEYEIHLIQGKGRSGGGIMVPEDASVWRVPPEHSGTINKNWLTKALRSPPYLSIIENIIQYELQRI